MQVLSMLSLASMALAAPAITKRAEPAPVLAARDTSKAIAGKYIIKMKNSAEITIAADTYKAQHRYSSDKFRGFAASLTEADLNELRNHSDVEYIEQDQEVYLFDYTTQDPAPWGISRISHEQKGVNTYIYDQSAGEGTCVYMIDTGIKVDHEEFEGRAEWVKNFTDDGNDGDGAGHGTWTAGLVASRSYGVAKKAKVLALKVFRDDGTTDGASIIAAMDYVVSDAPNRDCPAGKVANMSLGGGFSQASNDAADAMVKAGVFTAVAAGNSNVDAKDTSPASASMVCTVAASDENDAKADFSSFGDVVDIWAPGTNLESTSYEGGSTSASGTSGSSPIVAGIGAYLLALEGNIAADQLCDRIKELSKADVLSNVPEGTPNRLAFNGAPQ
ncbi:hypothetical protein N3K66_003484 [Trichothecium roseum]|uniref:Uncharacterized protein n=1 Tax=Trichothecium roseum TaxID=47278 RepID=A0ACC0V7C3_9HYPO|nr:hypothetical protein N3K66_003484 [Trichothecium roseum]